MTQTTREMILEFSKAFGRPVNDSVVPLTEDERLLLGKLLLEETLEYCFQGLGLELHSMDMVGWSEKNFELKIHPRAKYDPIESADGLGDVNVIINFNASWHGFDIDAVTREIHESNMSKLDGAGKPIINAMDDCHECDGRGLLNRDPDEHDRCGTCSGKGRIIKDPTKPIGKILKSPNFRKPDIDSVLRYSEDMCPGHARADGGDPKVCKRCGVHVDSFR